MRVSDFDFDLPDELIAGQPIEPRDAARLMVFDRGSGDLSHKNVRDLTELLVPGDLLVLNDTRVLPYRLLGHRESGGRVELLILALAGDEGCGYVKPARKVRKGEPVRLEDGALEMQVLEHRGDGVVRFRLIAAGGDVAAVIDRVGRAPLPPYIRRSNDADRAADRERYQTVFAKEDGAVAAPTAGLHFTPELLERLRANGVETTFVTLHVGEGTFAAVRSEAVEDHDMHSERFVLSAATADRVNAAKAAGSRVVAVGTTSARVLETCSHGAGVRAQSGETRLFLYPGRQVRVVDALLTNFHLPRSTLLMLVATLVGRERVLELYREAIARRYRFYSFGDAMLIL